MCVVYGFLDQLSEIRKTTFAAIICDNSGEIESVQLHVMHGAQKAGNERVGCDSLIKETSLDPWRENNVSSAAVTVRTTADNNNSYSSNDNSSSSKSGERLR